MNQKVHYQNCPVCGSDAIGKVLTANDYTVSNESFEIFHCSNCQLRFTQDVPDAAHIGPYYKSEEYISHTDTSKGLINKLYQTVRKKTLKSKRKLIQKETGLRKGQLLDIGSGTGAFVNEMKQHEWIVTGLEPDEDARMIAKKSYGIELQNMSLLWQQEPESFDAITLWHVLEHIHNADEVISLFHKVLNEEGVLVIAVPNINSLDRKIYSNYWAAYDVPRHLYHFSPTSMQHLAEKHGFTIVKQKRMWFDSFYVSMLSTQYQSKKINYLIAILVGVCSTVASIFHKEKCSSLIYILQKK